MVKSLRYLFLLIFIGFSGAAFAQSGAISGTVKDASGEPLIGAIVEVSQGGAPRGGAATDDEGKYTVKPLNPGTDYIVSVKYTGFPEIRLTKVQITADRTTYQNFTMKEADNQLGDVIVREYKVPLIKKDEPGTSTTLTGEQFSRMPTRATNDAVSLAGGTYQAKNGAGISIGGARGNGTLYIVDGVQVNGNSFTNFPPGAIDQISVITSGLPAKYGDALGGVVNITTNGPSATTKGNVGFEHSVDGYNHNLAFFDVRGPLLKKKADSLGNKKSFIGYSLNGQYQYDEDNDPNYYPNYYLKSDVLNNLRQNPLQLSESAGGGLGINYSTENVTNADLVASKKRLNAEYMNARGLGKIDMQVAENANVTLGGSFSYTKNRDYSNALSLFAPDAIPTQKAYSGRGFLRFTQKLGSNKPSVPGEEGVKKSVISNAYYTVQADYQVDYAESQSDKLKKNPFYYNYVGKFDQHYTPIYARGVDSSTNPDLSLIKLQTYLGTNGVDFYRSDMNPYLANYTSQIYNNFGDAFLPSSLQDIQNYRGMLNGDIPQSLYNLYTNVGTGLSGYGYNNAEQFAFNVDASFDLQLGKTRHAIEFGLYYQQRSERSFSFQRANQSVSIWNTMRLLANQHLLSLDESEPIFIKGGKQYTKEDVDNGVVIIGPQDTVIYQPRFDRDAYSTFSKNLRYKLGLDTSSSGRDYVNVDGLDPSVFSLDMFSADELLNSGDRFVNYYGYDYTGKRLNGQVNFNDWFTKKDANGNYTREVGAFRPNYTAGYIMDKFELPNNTLFNIGVRIERFDANTKVLRDPYSLYPTYTVGSNTGTNKAINTLNGGVDPSNMGSDYVIYVADNSSDNPQIVGYRNGDDWYDPYGRPIADPTIISRLYTTAGANPQPYLQRDKTKGRALTMRDAEYDPNTSFTDYKPQVNVMPRLSFTFPIADQSMFYAHYDMIVQRPKTVGEIYATPFDYYYLSQNAGNVIPNPDLKPEKMIDYEAGFQQALNTYSAVTLTAFYKERRDMIQVRPYLYAYPQTYYTYGNRDFSSTKGFILKYDLRRIRHLQMLLTYTLQFAEGTASTSTGSSGMLQNLIGASLPNLRFTYPLNVDSRHNIVLNLDYRYDKGEGPIIGKTYILENAGANLIFRTRSGEPYTRLLNPISNTIIGGPQNSRLPWHYMLDLKIDKQFNVSLGKSVNNDGVAVVKKRLGLNAFVYIQNVLNTRDVLGVYGYTGSATSNGYLTYPNGIQNAATQNNPQSYIDLYNLSNQNVGFINNPRRINIGLSVNF